MKKVLYGAGVLVVLSNMAAIYLWLFNFFTLQDAWKHCLKFNSTSAHVIGFKAYCGTTYMGRSFIAPVSELEDEWKKRNPDE